jgi:uncharacterized alkaline shock family protein YloU
MSTDSKQPTIAAESEELQLYPAEQGLGSILISPDVVARIAGMAVSEVEGVALMTPAGRLSLSNIFTTKEPVKGINVVKNESGQYTIVAEVKMAYNTPMWESAQRLQRHIKDTVERMTNLDLEAVDVRIVDIFMVDRDRTDED